MIPVFMLGIIGLTLTAAWLYQFKQPWKNYSEWQATLDRLQLEKQHASPLDNDILQIEDHIKALNKELNGDGPRLPGNQMVAHVIGRLDEIAEQHRVHLDGVRPGNSRRVLMFSETPYHVDIRGSYVNLFQWLSDVESKLGPLTIKEYKIDPGTGVTRRMKLTMVSYRLRSS